MQGLADRLGGFIGAQESGDQELACGLELRMTGQPVARRRSNISRVLRFSSVTERMSSERLNLDMAESDDAELSAIM